MLARLTWCIRLKREVDDIAHVRRWNRGRPPYVPRTEGIHPDDNSVGREGKGCDMVSRRVCVGGESRREAAGSFFPPSGAVELGDALR